MATPLERDSGEASIREFVGSLAQAIRSKDIDSLMAHYAPDVVVYDVRPPLAVQCAADYRKNFERWFASMPGPLEYEMSDLRIWPRQRHSSERREGGLLGAHHDLLAEGEWPVVSRPRARVDAGGDVAHRSEAMTQERPAPDDIPGSDGIEVLRRQDEGDTRERNGTGADADEEELGVTDEELDDLEDDAEGG
jgi:hypothetical protein